MAVYYRDEEVEPSFLESMLSSGLQAYQQKKQQSSQAQALGQMLGLDDNELKQFSAMSPDAQKLYVENMTKNNAIDQKTLKAQNDEKEIIKLLGLGNPTDPLQQPDVGQGQPTEQGFNLVDSLGIQQPAVTPPQQPAVTPPQQQKRYTQDEINKVTLINPNAGRIMQAQNEALAKEKQANADRENKAFERKANLANEANKTYFSNISARAEALPQKQAALDYMVESIGKTDLGYFSPDNIANMTGIEALRTPGGAQFISSGKEYFLGSLKRAGSRPNQWIEQQIQQMLPKIGRSKEANLTVAELLKVENAIEEKQIALTYQLSDQLEEELGYTPRDLPQRVNERLKPFVEEQQKLLESRLRDISGEGKLNKVEDGTPITQDIINNLAKKHGKNRSAAKKEAKELGYVFA